MPVDGLQYTRIVGADRANANDVFFGQRRIVEQDLNHVRMGVPNHALNQISFVRARQRLAFTKREWAATTEVRDAPFPFFAFAIVWPGQEIGEVVEVSGLGGDTEFVASIDELRIDERPPEGEEHLSRIWVCHGGGAIGFRYETEGGMHREARQLLRDQSDPHVDLVYACETPEQVRECRFLLHDLAPPSAYRGWAGAPP